MVLNELRHALTDYIPNLKVNKLKELLGHSPTEVFAGALWGIIVSAVLHYSIAYLV